MKVMVDPDCPPDTVIFMSLRQAQAFRNLGYDLSKLGSKSVWLQERRLKKAVHLLWPAADKSLCGKTIAKVKPTSPENLRCPECYQVAMLRSRLTGETYRFPKRKCLASYEVSPVSTLARSQQPTLSQASPG